MIQLAEQQNKDAFFMDFSRLQNDSLDNELTWHNDLRKQAMKSYAELGMPTIKDEEWQYTNLAPMLKVDFQRLLKSEIAGGLQESLKPYSLRDVSVAELVFVDGHFIASLSKLPGGLRGLQVMNMTEAWRTQRDFVNQHLGKYSDFNRQSLRALNTAFMQDGAFIRIAPQLVVDAPIHLLFVTTAASSPQISYPRNLIVAGDRAQANIIESFVGLQANEYCTNTLTEVVVGADAIIEHSKLQQASDKAFHFAALSIKQERGSQFTSNAVLLGGKLVRNDIDAVLSGEGSVCTLNGLFLGRDHQHLDSHTVIDHAMPHCQSHELYKGILDDHSRGVFSGKIIVRPDAQKIDAKQSNSNLLLSDHAVINTKPNLEIFADDVKCTHGATIGRLDSNAIFYLRSRGIGDAEARNLLTFAFANEIIERINCETVCDRLASLIWCRLPGSRQESTEGFKRSGLRGFKL